jgi:hypothetical protein
MNSCMLQQLCHVRGENRGGQVRCAGLNCGGPVRDDAEGANGQGGLAYEVDTSGGPGEGTSGRRAPG